VRKEIFPSYIVIGPVQTIKKIKKENRCGNIGPV
jgi:hypothetical protein